MDIRSTPSGYTPKAQTGRARDAAPASSARSTGPAPAPADETPVDRVELSPAARELNARLGGGDPSGGLTAARIRELVGRLQSGYYSRSEVVDRVIRRALADLSDSSSQG